MQKAEPTNEKTYFVIFHNLLFRLCPTSCSALRADEPTKKPELNCEAFVSEKICNMTDAEREIHFLELLKKILEDTLDEKKKGLDI